MATQTIHRCRSGFTLVELITAMLASTIMMLGVSGMLAHKQKAFRQLHDRAFGEVVSEAYQVRHAFERLVSQASVRNCTVGTLGTFLEIYLYSTPTQAAPDRYAQFYLDGTALKLETGNLAEEGRPNADTGRTSVLALHVVRCTFVQDGIATRMHLALDDGTQKMTVSACASRHNP